MRRHTLFLFLFFCSVFAKAQQYNYGFYINSDNKIIEGIIAIDASADHLFIKEGEGAKKVRVSIDDIKTVIVNTDDGRDSLVVKMDSVSPELKRWYFARPYIDAAIKLYKKSKGSGTTAPMMMMAAPGSGMGATFVGGYSKSAEGFDVMVEIGEVTIKVVRKNFKPLMLKLTAEFPSLYTQITDGTYSYGDLDTIIASFLHLKKRKAEGKRVD